MPPRQGPHARNQEFLREPAQRHGQRTNRHASARTHVTNESSPQGRFAPDAALVDGAELVRIEPYGKHLRYVKT